MKKKAIPSCPDARYTHFLEPMISREFLLRPGNFTLPVPRPAVLARDELSHRMRGYYDKNADAYDIVFKGFEPIK
jgi:hypothetical protein